MSHFSALFAAETVLVPAFPWLTTGRLGRRCHWHNVIGERESKPPRKWSGLHQLHPERIAHAITLMAALAHQCLALFVMVEIIRSQATNRDQAFGARFRHPHEQAEAGNPGNAGLENLAHALFH